jgi:cytochrome c oxidase subunit IV
MTLFEVPDDRAADETTLDRYSRQTLAIAGRFERELWVFVLVLTGADIGLTMYGLQLGFQELNPVAVFMLERAGVLGLVFLKCVVLAFGLVYWLVLPRRFGPLVPLGISLPWFAAVSVNSLLIVQTL